MTDPRYGLTNISDQARLFAVACIGLVIVSVLSACTYASLRKPFPSTLPLDTEGIPVITYVLSFERLANLLMEWLLLGRGHWTFPICSKSKAFNPGGLCPLDESKHRVLGCIPNGFDQDDFWLQVQNVLFN